MDSKRFEGQNYSFSAASVELANTNVKSNNVYKKGSTTQRVYKVKQWCRTIFELGGEDEMEAMSSVTFSTQLREVWDMHRRNRRALVFIKQMLWLWWTKIYFYVIVKL